jgi:hypothetical protein
VQRPARLGSRTQPITGRCANPVDGPGGPCTSTDDRRRLEMITLTARLWLWSGETANWHFISIPEDLATDLRGQGLARRGGFGSVRVEARIDDVTWRTSVFPQKGGGYLLPVKAEVRRRANIAAGDDVTLVLDLI